MVASFNTNTGLLISNPNPYPDGAVEYPFAPGQLAAAGSTQAAASAIVTEVTVVTNNTTTNGVILPVPTPGQKFFLYPALVTAALKVYPPVGGSINSAGVNTAVTCTARKMGIYIALDTTGNYIFNQGA